MIIGWRWAFTPEPEGTGEHMLDLHSDEAKRMDRKVYSAICKFWQLNNYGPTIREIGEMVGRSSTSHMRYWVRQLADRGLVEYEPKRARAIRPASQGGTWQTNVNVFRLPISGRIQAGQPILVPGSDFPSFDPDTYVDISANDLGVPPEQVFALQVKGESMRDANVNDGDIVILHATKQARNGQMVAAWLKNDEETTLKQFFLEGSQVRLQPKNPDFKAIMVNAEDVEVQGVVIKLIRNYML
jgi:repressor LexA